ncbi:unnamed protein product [Rhizoctonia solani]|uniref:Fungal-type protein kinase domain-containing protein n=1 Tax=Rhizoctonia solani TaxID=456999 RepID=A0A8H3GYE4_9AGAM|nr:unnamed protein product [Rhizoctonia solani]
MPTSYPPSSPIGQGFAPVETLNANDSYANLGRQNIVQEVPPKTFMQSYLQGHSPILHSAPWSSEEALLIAQIRSSKKSADSGDAPIFRLLNNISQRVFESLDNPEWALKFCSADKRMVQNPFTGLVYTPDIAALWERSTVFPQIDYTQNNLIPQTWCVIAAVGEVKTTRHGKNQLGTYLRNLLQLHPELNAVFGFTAKKDGYALFYHDADVIHQGCFTWEQPDPLYAFVKTLYTRPFQDTSMQLVAPQSQDLAWATKVGTQVYISETPRSLAGPGQRRYTTMAIDIATSARVFIKDVWRDPRQLFFEALLFEQAHEGEPLPGLMLVDSHGYVLDETQRRITTAAHQLTPNQGRYKMRMVTKDIGRPLETVQSLRQFLCVMYDACVVQRNLYRKCHILHRDISDGNIMLAPVTDQYRTRCKNGYAEVKFVNQVLRADGETTDPAPTCLVIDLGNGADLKVTRDKDQLRQRTGTPKFIARSVSSGMFLTEEDYPATGVCLPLPDEIEDYLHRMHTTEYQHEVPSSPNPTAQPDQTFAHRLFHDAESTFWVIAWTLVRSAGRGYQGEQNQDMSFRRFYHIMSRHFPVPGDEDTRAFSKGPSYWDSLLHPDLKSLGPMLHQMFIYVRPEWAYRPTLNPEHVHEALMRLLLAEIIKLDHADIPLVIGVRSIPPPPAGMSALPTSLYSISGSVSLSPVNRTSSRRNSRAVGLGVTNTVPSVLPNNSRSNEPVSQLGHDSPQLASGPNAMIAHNASAPTSQVNADSTRETGDTVAHATREQLMALARSLGWQPGVGQLQDPRQSQLTHGS